MGEFAAKSIAKHLFLIKSCASFSYSLLFRYRLASLSTLQTIGRDTARRHPAGHLLLRNPPRGAAGAAGGGRPGAPELLPGLAQRLEALGVALDWAPSNDCRQNFGRYALDTALEVVVKEGVAGEMEVERCKWY